jgi:exopolysaccharide biosynthesis protein
MKKLSTAICLGLTVIFFCLSISAQDFKTLQNGIEYAEMTREINKLPVNINLLRLDLTKVRLDAVHAMDAAIGTETVSSMATRHRALAAINAGFFEMGGIFDGDAAGVLMIDNHLISESYKNRIALFIDNFLPDQTIVKFAHLEINNIVRIKGKTFDFSGINRPRKDDELIQYTPYFHRTTLTNNDGLEIVVKKRKIVRINNGRGNSIIPQDGFVISASGRMRDKILPLLKIGRKAKLSTITPFAMGKTGFPNDDSRRTTDAFSRSEDIVGGIPQLIRNGKIEITWEKEKTSQSFVETRHPRTAAAKLKDGKFLMITVDGRSEESAGIDLQNLAELLLELGATDALNLDGGGSTTMFVDGKVVNKPSDKTGERRVSDAILVFPRKKL